MFASKRKQLEEYIPGSNGGDEMGANQGNENPTASGQEEELTQPDASAKLGLPEGFTERSTAGSWSITLSEEQVTDALASWIESQLEQRGKLGEHEYILVDEIRITHGAGPTLITMRAMSSALVDG